MISLAFDKSVPQPMKNVLMEFVRDKKLPADFDFIMRYCESQGFMFNSVHFENDDLKLNLRIPAKAAN